MAEEEDIAQLQQQMAKIQAQIAARREGAKRKAAEAAERRAAEAAKRKADEAAAEARRQAAEAAAEAERQAAAAAKTTYARRQAARDAVINLNLIDRDQRLVDR